MKPSIVRSIAVSVIFITVTAACHANLGSYEQIVRERDSVLSQILADREGKRSSGLADEEAIATAQLALYSFRRDVAKDLGEKMKNQELIVHILETKLKLVKSRQSAGVGAKIHVLEAMAPLLEAKQILEELRLSAKQD